MKHARKDYDRIQDSAGEIAEDEPVMLFRAQDRHMCAVLQSYANLLSAAGNPMSRVVIDFMIDVSAWQHKNGCKEPDMP